MLALISHRQGGDGRAQRGDEAGVALVVVVVLMFVGVIIATAIAAMLVTTIRSNSTNMQNTQAYVAAESGRDAAVAAIASAITAGDGTLACTSGFAVTPDNDPAHEYTASVRWATATEEPAKWSTIVGGADSYSSCPTSTSNWVVIHATGTADGKTTFIDSAYVWSTQPDTRPAGTLAFFEGEFTATKSTYQGDLVIRGTDNYECNNGAGNALEGDLWVTNASVDVTGDCYVTGNIYAYGYVDARNKNLHVGGDIITETGDINLASDGVVVGGQIYSGRNVILTKSGTVGNGTVIKAVGTTGTIPATWTHADLTPVTGQSGQPVPTFTPTLQAVHDATAWLELDATKGLSTDSEVYPNASVPSVCTSAQLTSILQTAGTRAFIDMSGCVSGSAVTVQPNPTIIRRDALIYVPPSTGMKLVLSNALSDGGTDPELLFIHGDANIADNAPTCTTGADSWSVSAPIGVRTLVYSACGVNSTMALTMTGQLYMGSDGLHLNGGTFECAAMGWEPAFKNLACGVSGDGGVFDPSKTTQLIGKLTQQAEAQVSP